MARVCVLMSSSSETRPTKPATKHTVQTFREILLWPLTVDGMERDRIASHLVAGGWDTVTDRLRAIPPLPRTAEQAEPPVGDRDTLPPDAYEEFVYFHPFVQRLLYGSADRSGGREDDDYVRLFRPTDTRKAVAVTVVLRVGGKRLELTLSVDRMHLYCFRPGLIILVVEVSCQGAAAVLERAGNGDGNASRRDLTLADAMLFIDHFRRCYPPYWDQEDTAGRIPERVTWRFADGSQETRSPLTRRDADAAVDQRSAPVSEHWLLLLRPLGLKQAGRTDGLHVCRHVVDERLPMLVFLTVNTPAEISDGDWIRLCFADEPGQNAFPYAPGYPPDFKEANCYDRFWDPDQKTYQTRYLVSGYNFVIVGVAHDWFTNQMVQNHFRQYYFQMALIAHQQHATLLMLSDDLSKAMKKAERRQKAYIEAIEKVRDRITDFTHLAWFSQLSNQTQANDLFAYWRRHLGLQGLYDAVTREAREASVILDTEEQKRTADAAVRLGVIGAVGLCLTIITGAFGMNLFENGPATRDVPLLFGLSAGVFLLAGVGLRSLARRDEAWLAGAAGLLVWSGLGALVIWLLTWIRPEAATFLARLLVGSGP